MGQTHRYTRRRKRPEEADPLDWRTEDDNRSCQVYVETALVAFGGRDEEELDVIAFAVERIEATAKAMRTYLARHGRAS